VPFRPSPSATLESRLTEARAEKIDNLDVLLSTRLALTNWNTRLTSSRATNLDQITAARLAELDPAGLPTDLAYALIGINSQFILDRGRVKTVEPGDPADWHVELIDMGGGIIPSGNIDSGTGSIEHWRGVTLIGTYNLVTTAGNGEVHAAYVFAAATWLPGDQAHVIFSGCKVTVGGVETSLPNIEFHVRVSRDAAISTTLNRVKIPLEYLSDAVNEQIAATGNLTVHAITPPDLSAYTIHKVMLICIIHSSNPISGTDQRVTVQAQGEKTGVGYGNLGNSLTEALQMTSVQYGSDSIAYEVDVTALVDTLDGAQVYNFRFAVTLANAQNTRFTHQFVLVPYVEV